jgi:hypothetical protein
MAKKATKSKHDQIVTTTELGNIIGIAPRSVREYITKGVMTKHSRGKVILCDAVQGYIGAIKAAHKIAIDQQSGHKRGIDAERERKLKMENDAREDLLIPANEVSELWGSHITACKRQFLSMPRALAARLAKAKSAGAVEKILRKKIYEALEELATEDETE